MRKHAIGLSVLLMALGCAKKETPLEAGWTRVESESAGVSVGVPPGWRGFDLLAPDLTHQLDKLAQEKPHVAPATLAARQLLGQGHTKIYALNVEATDPEALGDAVMVIVADNANVDDERGIKEFVQGMEDQFQGDSNLSYSKASFSGLEGYVVEGTPSVQSATGPTMTHIRSYVVQRGGKVYAISTVCMESRWDQNEAVFLKVGETIRL